MEQTQPMKLSVPGAIVLAGALIAGGLFLSRTPVNTNDNDVGVEAPQEFRVVEASDHVRGNREAPVALIEFSDFECPFCARFHPTVQRLLTERPDDVYWVYRHYPLSSIHSEALASAIASECVAELAGNDAFWTFSDALFANQQTLGEALYITEAAKLGIDQTKFAACQEDPNVQQAVETDLQEAIATGGSGTPYTIFITPSGKLLPVSGALPYEQISAALDQALGD